MSCTRISLPRLAAESVVVIFSILAAFAIDAWWDGIGERRQERDALEVLSRDLEGSISQLEEYVRFMDDNVSASVGAYTTLSQDGFLAHRDELTDQLRRTLRRRTLRLPRSAYSDLAGSGAIRFIRSEELRDEILAFYEAAERAEEIVSKNSDLNIDGLMQDVLVRNGLFLPRLAEDDISDLHAEQRSRFEARFDPDFEHPADPLWSVPPGAREWDRLRSALLRSGAVLEISGVIAGRLLERAKDLQASIAEYLGREAR